MSKNDITGDKLVSKVQSEKFSEGYDRIWGKKEATLEDALKLVKSITKPRGEVLHKKSLVQEALDAKCAEIMMREFMKAPPLGYTAEELERDNPYNQWMYEGENEC